MDHKSIKIPKGIIAENNLTNHKDIINVEINVVITESISYSLLDMTGRIIEKGRWNLNSTNSKFTINVSNAVNGIYLLKLRTDEGQSSFRVLNN